MNDKAILRRERRRTCESGLSNLVAENSFLLIEGLRCVVVFELRKRAGESLWKLSPAEHYQQLKEWRHMLAA
jgi:hypothetical protein